MNKTSLWILTLSGLLAANRMSAQFREPVLMQSSSATNTVLPRGAEAVQIDENKLYRIEKRNLQYYSLPDAHLREVVTKVIDQPVFKAGTKFPTSWNPQISLGIERKVPVAFVLIPQFIQRADGKIEQLISFQLSLNENNPVAAKTAGARVYADHSVLANGQWYKIAVSKGGLQKITYEFIQNQFNISASAINPANIRLFGNGGQMLDENNAVARPDDLIENAIWVEDGGDGQFNQGDYFLFYAPGPDRILKDSVKKAFTHQKNVYSETSHYFLTFNSGPGKRIGTTSIGAASNVASTFFNEFYFYEKDSSNLGKFGKAWYGEEFSDLPGRYLNRTFATPLENLVAGSPVELRVRMGSIHSSGISVMSVSINGTPAQNIQFQPIGFSFSDPVLRMSDFASSINVNSTPLNVQFSYSKGNSSAAAYLDFFEINCRRNLVFNGHLNFADWNTVGTGNVAQYTLQNANTQLKIWDITDPLQPTAITGTLNGSSYSFKQEASQLHRFLAFDGSVVQTPIAIGTIANQDLHNYKPVDYIIITHPSLKSEAERLANYHQQKRNYRTLVLTPDEIYNEFSSGTQDVSAIRDYLKMLYDRSSLSDLPDYVLFFGDASYDYKDRISNNSNMVPTYETNESIEKTLGYCTDDYFGFLDDQENINNYSNSQINTLDIGIGRFPVKTAAKASDIVNKIMNYDSPASFGPWKNNMTFNADDGDDAIHFEDGEIMAAYVKDSLPQYNLTKIYVDGFTQQSTPAGPRTPDANAAVGAQIFNGTFLMNYNGHGGPLGWCEERIFSMDDINAMNNFNKLPLFITATCDFAPFDNPTIESAGEILLTKSNGGAIALMTTTQLVYADQNRIMNLNYMQSGFKAMKDKQQMPTLGDAYRLSKNIRYVSSISEFAASNFRKFVLLGDPGLPLAFPKHVVKTDSINGMSITQISDTLKALGKYTISGHLEDASGNSLDGFNGIVYPLILDKPKKLSTLGNDADSPLRDYFVQNNALYKGKASIKNGKFSFTFVVPKDINYEIAKGKISYYASNETEDASGAEQSILIGGSSNQPITDNMGPEIKAYLNDEKFVNGGITTSNSLLLVKLSDENGINYTGNSLGHDITAVLDNNAQNTFVLNSFFEADLDDYRSGSVRFPLNGLSEGEHTLTIKAWDVLNNSSETTIRFIVVNGNDGKLAHVYNYPNPFTTKTRFTFEHNMPNQDLMVSIQIYTISGKVVRTLRSIINSPGTRNDEIEWDGRDQYGDRLGKGVYIYKLSIKNAQGYSDQAIQKLVLLQ